MKKTFSLDVNRLQREMEYRNYSERTVDSYCQTMDALEKNTSKQLSNLTLEDLKTYLHHGVVARNYSSSYVNQHISAFKIFTQDVLQQEWHEFKIKRPRRPQKLPEVLSLEEKEFIRRFLQHILPSGFSKIRYFGFLSLRHLQENIEQCLSLLNKDTFLPELIGLNGYEVYRKLTNEDPHKCKKCKKGKMQLKNTIEKAPS